MHHSQQILTMDSFLIGFFVFMGVFVCSLVYNIRRHGFDFLANPLHYMHSQPKEQTSTEEQIEPVVQSELMKQPIQIEGNELVEMPV